RVTQPSRRQLRRCFGVRADDWRRHEVHRAWPHDWSVRSNLEHHDRLGRRPERDDPIDHRYAMNDEEPLSTVVVVDRRSFEVTARRQSPQSSLLTVVADGREQWSFEVAVLRSGAL